MYITPILPKDINAELDKELLALCELVCIKSAALQGSHNPFLLNSIKSLLRKTNSYYSNKIESEGTHPVDVEKAMRREFATDSYQKKLQYLSLAHIKVQEEIESDVLSNKREDIFSSHYLLELHKKFYTKEGMEAFLEIEYEGQKVAMQAGTFREQDVFVGKHIAPKHEELQSILNEFELLYTPMFRASTKALKLLYALSAHHRLVWIHPFLDGNGRISRLFLDASFLSMQLEGYGLWNISRGLARKSDSYKQHLSLADMPLQGAMDGRGSLSLRGLKYYLRFMLETALDQIEFMSKNLQLNSLAQKIEKYVILSEQGLLGTQPLPKQSALLFKELLMYGELPRGAVKDIISKSDRTATALIQTLIKMDYLESDTPKSAIRLKINAEFASYLMPDLIPLK